MPDNTGNDIYQDEYNPDFVANWDDLIGWEGREQGERDFFHRLLSIHECKTVADVASGTGYHAVQLAKAGFEVTATDGSETMMRQTEANAREHGVKLADARTVDWRKLHTEFGNDVFDAVVCLGNAFSHLADHEARRDALANIFAVLKPGGLAIIDHRNYDAILEKGFGTKHQYYYTGNNVDARPIRIARDMVKFEYTFPDGNTHHLSLYPLKKKYFSFLLEDAGFMDVTCYGDFERPFEAYDPDFIQQLAFKPRRQTISFGTDDGADHVSRIVAETKRYYDGAADQIYKDVWGENIHLGLFEKPDDTLQTAMARANERMSEAGALTKDSSVLEVGCGYGGLARYLARTHGSKITATNLSERELEHGRKLTKEAGLEDRVSFTAADFHDLKFEDETFDSYWSQEAFLHAVDKYRVLSEAWRVLKPGGRLVFTDITLASTTPLTVRAEICSRVNAPDMWDFVDYRSSLLSLGFTILREGDWSTNVAPTYSAVRDGLEARRADFEDRIGRDLVDDTSRKLQFWVDQANRGRIGWAWFVAEKTTEANAV